MQLKISAYTGLFLAVLAVSWSSIFIRWCGDTPALIISFYRMLWSSLLFLVFFLSKPTHSLRIDALPAKERVIIFTAGLLLALHCATWIASLKYTTVAHSLILESTHPAFSVILSPFLVKERASWWSILAVLLTLIGITIIGGQDLGLRSEQLIGDLLAIASALFVSLYILMARLLRQKIDLVPYLMLVYGIAAFLLLMMDLLFGYPMVRYSLNTHLFMLLLALIPTGIGHSLINWAARKIEAYKVNLSILGEPLFASIMAYYFFDEVPYGLFYVGGTFIVTGILLAVGEHRRKKVLP